jgi:uncharacterized protein YigE (DUF2233 family)
MPAPALRNVLQGRPDAVFRRRATHRLHQLSAPRGWRPAWVGYLVWCAALISTPYAYGEPTIRWQTIAPDLETTTVSAGPLAASLVVVRSSLQRFRVGIVEASTYGSPRASVRRLVEASGAALGINANFFDTEGRALGLVVREGSVRQRLHGGGRTITGVFAVDANGPKIEGRIAYAPHGVISAVQAGPRLVIKGAPVTTLSTSGVSSRRAGVCIDQKGRTLFFVVSSALWGLTLQQLQELLIAPGLDCREALNLDGGGSAQLSVVPAHIPGGLKTAEIFIPGADEVPVMIGLFPLKPEGTSQ